MGKPGRRRTRRALPLTRYSSEDTILAPYDVSTFLRAMVLKGPFRFPPCGTEPCKPCTCWPSIRSPKHWLTRTLTGFGQPARQQTRSKPASLHSVKTTVRNGSSKEIYAPALTESRMHG